jgi:hypothetical protein
MAINQPSLPRNPPQTHHKNTTIKHRNFAKPPAKTPFHDTHKKRKTVGQIHLPNRP